MSDGKDTRGTRPWRRGGPVALVALLVAGGLVAALTTATNPLSASPFSLAGHWVYNSVLKSVFHIDGSTGNIDAQLGVNAEPGSQVVQGDTTGYVVGPTTTTEFGKGDLSVGRTQQSPVNELPFPVEGVGGPYVVYRNAGLVVRLGDPPAVINAGNAVSDPVLGPDGSMWLYRRADGMICTFPKGADQLAGCPVTAVPGDAGALSLVDSKPQFVDLSTGLVHTVDGDKLGAGRPVGVQVSPNSRVAAHDVAGRIAILDPEHHSLLLADTHTPPVSLPPIALAAGDYDGPVSTGSAVVLVDRQKGTVLTFDQDGRPKQAKPIQDKTGQPRITRGEDDHVYVEDANGTEVLVVAKDGEVRDVPVTQKPRTTTSTNDAGAPTSVAQGPAQPTTEPHRPSGPPATTQKPIPASPPGAPVNVSASPGNGSANVTWGAAASNRAEITSYTVTWQASTGQRGTVSVSGGARSTRVNGLTNGTRYTFTVAATNSAGTGPGASSNPVTPVAPVSPAGAPVNLKANFDVNDRPTRDVTLTWTQPALNGGTLQYYEVAATGYQTRQVTGTQTVYAQVQATQVITFTVRAVTKSPDGQTLTGQPNTTTHKDTQAGTPTVKISEGGATTSGNCHAPNCARVNVTMTGFKPNTTYHVTVSTNNNPQVQNPEAVKTNGSGSATYNELNYDEPGVEIWVTVVESGATSNHITWRKPS